MPGADINSILGTICTWISAFPTLRPLVLYLWRTGMQFTMGRAPAPGAGPPAMERQMGEMVVRLSALAQRLEDTHQVQVRIQQTEEAILGVLTKILAVETGRTSSFHASTVPHSSSQNQPSNTP